MSRSWTGGSTRAWRTTRARVLARDGYACRLKLPGCTGQATQVHHTVGRGTTGDDPRWLIAACRSCNLAVGDPTRPGKHHDPEPRPLTQW